VGLFDFMMREEKLEQVGVSVSVLAKLWPEDGVWNASAFDLPVAAYGHSIEQAQANFEEAIRAHFDALEALGKVDSTVVQLLSAQANRELSAGRLNNLPEHEMVTRYIVHPHQAHEFCAAGM
jgi:hypothetical protein